MAACAWEGGRGSGGGVPGGILRLRMHVPRGIGIAENSVTLRKEKLTAR